MANSYRTAERLHATYGVEAGVLHPPLDSRWLDRPLADPAGSPSALVVSRLRPDKHVDVAIAACARLGVPLTVVGEGPDLRRLQDLAGPSVTFIASLSDAALAAAYGAHSVVLCPGRDDFGLVALEAGSAGRPVVASSTGAGMETVLHRETGWLVGGWHADDWAAAVGSVLQRRWDASALRNAARRFGVGAFDDQLARWLEPLVDPGPSRPAVHAHEPAGTASVPRALVTS
jgi:glycosyltransferase involved in cell wall biosynthesis